MIRIPSSRYLGLANKHYYKIQDYIICATKFYLKCCYTFNPRLRKSGIDLSSVDKLHINTQRSLFAAISDLNYRSIEKKYLFDKKYLKKEFKNDIKLFSALLERMLDIRDKIYVKNIILSETKNYQEIQEELCLVFKYSNIVKKRKGTKEGKKIKSSKIIEDSQLVRDILCGIFNYSKFSNNDINNWNAYHYCKHLGVNVCPYCNRIYTHTITNKDENIIRPSLDHYIPQSRYPLFGLSFFNLIPSCTYCNSSIKNDKDDFTLEHKVFDNYLHPYFDNGKFSFQFKPFDINGFDGDKDKIKIEIIDEENKKVKNSLVFFKISDIYQVHNDIVASLISKRIKYNDENLKMIGKLINVEKEELFKVAFDIIEEEEIIDYSLGKLKRDITNQLKKLTL